MRVLGISGSPRRGATTDRLVQEVLSVVECETEFVSLAGLRITPCGACLGCVQTNECVVDDDMTALREKIASADGYVIGAPNYFSILNAQMHALLERWFQFRHLGGREVLGKVGVAVGVGGGNADIPAENIETFFRYNAIECLGRVTAMGAANCYICGVGLRCEDGAIFTRLGHLDDIPPDEIPDLSKQPEATARAREMGKALSDHLIRR